MNSRERVMSALALKVPDYVPFVNWVDAEVKQRIEKLAPGGGCILSSANSITEFCKPENVLAMVNARNKYGKYPINLD